MLKDWYLRLKKGIYNKKMQNKILGLRKAPKYENEANWKKEMSKTNITILFRFICSIYKKIK